RDQIRWASAKARPTIAPRRQEDERFERYVRAPTRRSGAKASLTDGSYAVAATMPEELAPGVYIEELAFGSHTIEGVRTSTAGFVGEAVNGPRGQAVKLTSLTDFEREFGGLDPTLDLGYAVKQ